jgi:hypothetical protein
MKTFSTNLNCLSSSRLFSTNHKYIGTLYRPSTLILSPVRFDTISSFSRLTIYDSFSRSMFTVNNSSRKVIANTFFQGLKHVTKPSVLENVTPKDHSSLVESIMQYTVDHQNGTPQHKGAFMFNIFRQKFSIGLFQKELNKQVPNSLIEWPKNGLADSRVVSEIPVAIAIAQDLPFLSKLFMTNDLPPSNPNHPNFINRKQPNTDIEMDLKGPYGEKRTYMDIKSGADMVNHTTRGHAGIITIFEDQIVPFTTNKQYSSAQIFNRYNKDRINGLSNVLEIDKPITDFSQTLKKIDNIYKDVAGYSNRSSNSLDSSNSSFLESVQLHTKAQHLLWSEIQCHPEFKRSVGVIFVRTINRLPTDDEYNAYLSRINALLPNGHYDMSKISDKKLLLRISIKAYLETVDSKVHNKLEFLATNNIQLDDVIMDILTNISNGKFT